MSAGLRARVITVTPDLDVAVEVPSAGTLAVMGPNGAGKSTLLSVLAGLRRPAAGSSVRLDERTLIDASTFVPPHRRRIALLAQDPGLFPHLSVADNIAYAPRAQHLPRAEVAARVDSWLTATDTTNLAERRPHQLSGGQAQRVALARALAAEPSLLLLDEPFRALDMDVAARLRALLRTVLDTQPTTTVLVTHDVADAVTLADDLVVLEDGRVREQGPVTDLLRSPRTGFTSRLAGLSLVAGTWHDGHLIAGALRVAGVATEPLTDGAACVAVFAPGDVSVFDERPHGSPRNVLQARVERIDPWADRARLACAVGAATVVADVTWSAVRDLSLAVGSPVFLTIKQPDVQILPTPGGAAVT